VENWRDAEIDDPTEPYNPAPPLQSAPHRPWSTITLVLHSLGLVVGILALGLGVAALIAEYSAPPPDPGVGESWGLFVGLFFGTGGVVMGLSSAALTRLCVVGRRNADEGRPRVLRSVGVVALVLAGLGAAGSVAIAFPAGLVVCGLYALPAVFLLRTMRAGAGNSDG
jgi:hypothetical protein